MTGRATRTLLAATLTLMAIGTAAEALGAPQETLAETYLEALKGLWTADASADELASFLDLLAQDATYAHPRAGARVTGRSAIGRAMAGFLGRARAAELSNVQFVSGAGVEVVGFDLTMETHTNDGWQPIERRQVVVLEVAEGRVTGIRDYW